MRSSRRFAASLGRAHINGVIGIVTLWVLSATARIAWAADGAPPGAPGAAPSPAPAADAAPQATAPVTSPGAPIAPLAPAATGTSAALPLTPSLPPPPVDAASALDRARAAYEYGDLATVIDSSRLVTEGALRATVLERAQALRLHGIALFLVGRTAGAESSFFELLRLNPGARLDPTTTRPDAVAFFEQVRRHHKREIGAAARAGKNLLWCFLPPFGQIQNGNRKRAIVFGAVEGLALAGAITTRLVLSSWQGEHYLFGEHTEAARSLATWNKVSIGVLAAAYVVGVLDALVTYGDVRDVEAPFQQDR